MMKIIKTLLDMVLLVSMCSAAHALTDEDQQWLDVVQSNNRLIMADLEIFSSAETDRWQITALQYVKADAIKGLNDSERYNVSEELQKAKDYYELSMKENYNWSTELSDAINTTDASKSKSAGDHQQAADRYSKLLVMELNAYTGTDSTPGAQKPETKPSKSYTEPYILIKCKENLHNTIGQYTKADVGKVYLVADLQIENHGYKEFSVNPNYVKIEIDNVQYDYSWVSVEELGLASLDSVTLKDGGITKGAVAFEIPSDSKEYSLVWDAWQTYNVKVEFVK